MLEKLKTIGEAEEEELKWDAFWSWRANPPSEGTGEHRRVMSFDKWWRRFNETPHERVKPDEEKIARLLEKFGAGQMRET